MLPARSSVSIAAVGAELAYAVWMIGIVDVRRVGWIDKNKIAARIGQRQTPGIRLLDIGTTRHKIEPLAQPIEVMTDIEGGARATHGIKNPIADAGITGEQLPDDPTGGGSGVVGVALHAGASPVARQIVLRRILPERRGERL